MSDPRFVVHEHAGYEGSVYAPPDDMPRRISFYIMDRLYNCRVVETFNAKRAPGGKYRQMAKWKAEERAAQLNEWWRLERAR